MIGSSTICYIAIGVIVTGLFGLVFYTGYNSLYFDHWLPQTIVVAGMVIISLTACAGIADDNDAKTEKSIENTITANYDHVLNYHNDENNKTFVSDGSKYTFDYNEKTQTLIVFKGSDVDTVFVDGVKHKGEK